MIQKTLLSLCATALLSTSVIASGDTAIGVSVAGKDTTTIITDFKITETLRLEPSLGFTQVDYEDYRDESTYRLKQSKTTINIGFALHSINEVSSTINLYYGGYLGYKDYNNDTYKSNNYSNIDLFSVAGVEYSFDPQFTLGMEVGFGVSTGDEETTVTTQSKVTLRYYFDSNFKELNNRLKLLF